jgi:zinc protease
MEVQTVTSPRGIKAWLVEDYAEPMFALRFAFQGGSVQDPFGKEGLANFVALTLKQGAGAYTAVELARAIANVAFKVEFYPQPYAIKGNIEALSETRDEVAAVVNLLLTKPRFDDETVERVRRRLLSYHGAEARVPLNVANQQWAAAAYAEHPYGRPGPGIESSIKAITSEDLKTYHRRVFATDRLTIVAVGDITQEELGEFLDRLFAGLPARAELADVPMANPPLGGRLRLAEMDIPQSVVTFGTGAVQYDSPDYFAACVLNHVLGGEVFFSRLGRELRQKRGLAHRVVTWLEHHEHAAIFRGSVATRNDAISQSLELVRAEMRKMADGNLSQSELDNAKSHLIGSQPLAFASHTKIATELLSYALAGFGPDHFGQRSELLGGVTLEAAKRVAAYLLDPENLIISIAGSPALQPARKS